MTMMKSSWSVPFLLQLLLLLGSSTVSGLGSVFSKYYWHSSMPSPWQVAQDHCRRGNDDLATLYTTSDEDSMYFHSYFAWIGLQRDTLLQSEWVWSNGKTNERDFWARDEPHSSEDCAVVHYSTRKVYGTTCEAYHFFLCNTFERTWDYRYTFIPLPKTWSEAQEYCKNYFNSNLATFQYMTDLLTAVKTQNFPLWIGLHRDGETWKWSKDVSRYRNWADDEPKNNGNNCVSISSLDKGMTTQPCSSPFPFICMRDNIVIVKENKTWEEALDHCRTLGYDLVSVQPGEDHNIFLNKVTYTDIEEVWVSLRFLAGHWLWVNGADMLYPDLPQCPLDWKHCGVFTKNNTGSVEIRDCTEKKNFMCYSK